jgi:hypothetical protein
MSIDGDRDALFLRTRTPTSLAIDSLFLGGISTSYSPKDIRRGLRDDFEPGGAVTGGRSLDC